jgi:hypothetical protein
VFRLSAVFAMVERRPLLSARCFDYEKIMFEDAETGVVIADQRCGVRLTRAGEANELGYPTLIEVRAGPFTGVVRDDTVGDYSLFLQQLESFYQQLSGTAKLGSYEGFSFILTGRNGSVDISAVIIGAHVPQIRLTFEICLDQSYLPPIIQAIRREFPPPTRVRYS